MLREIEPELKARAFTISGVTAFDVLQRVRDEVATVPAGARWDDAKKKIVEEIHPFLADPEDPDNTEAAERRAETLLRTHGFQAYGAARYRNQAAQKDIFPYCQYVHNYDAQPRPSHLALHGLIFPFDSEFVQTHQCPWDWGCKCGWIQLSEDDAREIREKDADREPDHREVIEGAQLKHVETTGHLVRGVNQIFDVRTPVEKGEPGAFTWDPRDLRLPLDKLKERYEPQVWSAFEKWARNNQIPETGTSIFGWLSGEKLVAETLASTARTALRLPGVMTPVPVPPRVDPVGGKLRIPDSHPDVAALSATMTVVDSVHDDGGLNAIPLLASRGTRIVGEFTWNEITGKATGITISSKGPHPELTLLHEIGHWVALGMMRPGEGARIVAALEKTVTAKEIRRMIRTGKSRPGIRSDLLPSDMDDLRDMVKPGEMLARAYAQWIARKSGHARLLAQIAEENPKYHGVRFFSEQEAAQIDKLFTEALGEKP